MRGERNPEIRHPGLLSAREPVLGTESVFGLGWPEKPGELRTKSSSVKEREARRRSAEKRAQAQLDAMLSQEEAMPGHRKKKDILRHHEATAVLNGGPYGLSEAYERSQAELRRRLPKEMKIVKNLDRPRPDWRVWNGESGSATGPESTLEEARRDSEARYKKKRSE